MQDRLARFERIREPKVKYEHEGDEEGGRGGGRVDTGDDVGRHAVDVRGEEGRIEQGEQGVIESSFGG